MLWAVSALTFLATVAVVGSLLYAFLPGQVGPASRLSELLNPATPSDERRFTRRQKEKVRDTLASVGRLIPSGSGKRSNTELLMLRAGYRNANASLALRGARILLPIILLSTVYLTGIYRSNPFMFLALSAVGGYMLPDMWLTWRVRARQHRLRLALPDGLDLLVICVEAGLGLDQALMRVAEELRITHPDLSDEFQFVNLEMRIGKTRIEALRELARRTGLDDIKALVAMLIQTERFGTSVAQSLRVHSDDMRVKRRQRAEELAAKTTVKMVPALVFLIFPALMAVILGPAAIILMRQFPGH
jgi:tight adherence protein C